MATREEIREGIRAVLQAPLPRGVEDSLEYFTDLMVRYLHSHDVMLKVERKPPRLARGEDPSLYTFQEGIDCMLKAGYSATEPLIKEE
jgi:hypothetical protein